ncbi:MAG: cation-transporting P-type ATPase [Thermoplasmata archaeon]|nr:cation-transporting P-type ATPase [Thermoplasmata archaeon]
MDKPNHEKPRIKDLISCQEDELYAKLRAKKGGLTADEAVQRLKEHGPNILPEQKKKPLMFKFFEHLGNLFNILLLVAAGLSFFVGVTTNDQTSYQMSFAIVAVVLISIVFTLFQEKRAQKTVDAIKDLVPRQAKALRDGQTVKVPVADIVPGDIIYLEDGDKVPADARLIECFSLSVDNSILTGESNLQKLKAECAATGEEADVDLYKRRNILFAGTTIGSGNGTAVVLATGADTEFGRIVSLAQSVVETKSPLQKQLDGTARLNFVAAISVGITFFIASQFYLHLDFMTSIIFMIGVMICLVPEGLQITVTLSLALSSLAMSKRQVVVKRLSSVETLGSCTVICSDKTGTITEGQMTVRKIWIGGESFHVSGEGYDPEGTVSPDNGAANLQEREDFTLLCRVAALDSTATLVPPLDRTKSRWTAVGDSTDAALTCLAAKSGYAPKKLMTEQPRVGMLPFDSNRMMMSSIHAHSGRVVCYTKGAGNAVISRCRTVYWDGQIVPLTEEIKERITVQIEAYAKDTYRVIALAFRPLPSESEPYTSDAVEVDLTFIGLTAIYDPPRLEVPEAISKARTAGIKVVMITGDNEVTAEAIARKVGIISGEQYRVISGRDLAKMSDGDLLDEIGARELVFARITPEQKLRIVKAFKAKGEIVAVTGDGVNDAPALLEADIGVAMGLAGTDVARESADMVLLDDNFASIVNGIEEGRAVFDNLKKFIVYVFCHNWSEMVAFLAFVLLGCPLPLAVIQVLLIDLFLEIPSGLSLTNEPPEPGTMEQPPRKKGVKLFDKWAMARAAYIGFTIGVYTLMWVFFYWSQHGWQFGEQTIADQGVYLSGMTIMTVGVVAGQLGVLFAMRTGKKSGFLVGFRRNKWLVWAAIIEIVGIILVIHIPVVNSFFSLSPIPIEFWLALYLIAPVVFLMEEFRKGVFRLVSEGPAMIPVPAVPEFITQTVITRTRAAFIEKARPTVMLTHLVPGEEDALSMALTLGKQAGSRVAIMHVSDEPTADWMKKKLTLLTQECEENGGSCQYVNAPRSGSKRHVVPVEALRKLINEIGADTMIVPVERNALIKRGRLKKKYSWLNEFSDIRLILVAAGKEKTGYKKFGGYRILVPVLKTFHMEPFEIASNLSQNPMIPDVDVIAAKVVEMPAITPLYSIYRADSLIDKEKELSFLRMLRGLPLLKTIHSKVLLVHNTVRDLASFIEDRKVDIVLMGGDWSAKRHGFITTEEREIVARTQCTVAVTLPPIIKGAK